MNNMNNNKSGPSASAMAYRGKVADLKASTKINKFRRFLIDSWPTLKSSISNNHDLVFLFKQLTKLDYNAPQGNKILYAQLYNFVCQGVRELLQDVAIKNGSDLNFMNEVGDHVTWKLNSNSIKVVTEAINMLLSASKYSGGGTGPNGNNLENLFMEMHKILKTKEAILQFAQGHVKASDSRVNYFFNWILSPTKNLKVKEVKMQLMSKIPSELEMYKASRPDTGSKVKDGFKTYNLFMIDYAVGAVMIMYLLDKQFGDFTGLLWSSTTFQQMGMGKEKRSDTVIQALTGSGIKIQEIPEGVNPNEVPGYLMTAKRVNILLAFVQAGTVKKDIPELLVAKSGGIKKLQALVDLQKGNVPGYQVIENDPLILLNIHKLLMVPDLIDNVQNLRYGFTKIKIDQDNNGNGRVMGATKAKGEYVKIEVNEWENEESYSEMKAQVLEAFPAFGNIKGVSKIDLNDMFKTLDKEKFEQIVSVGTDPDVKENSEPTQEISFTDGESEM